MKKANKQQIERLLTRGVEKLYPSRDEFKKRLSSGKKMKLYLGVDPTSPHLHIGHALVLRKLAEFQELGHEVILLIGSFTAMIGDPTDKMATRVALTQKEVLANAASYKKQAGKILKFSGSNAAKIMFNHKWLGKMSFGDVVELASHFTVQQMLERDMFERRIKDGKPVYLHEFLYPLMQGYDSVAMDVDLEVGGSDQTFNMLAGRTLMKAIKQKEKLVMTTKLLTNDEGKKMSKSEGGLVALDDVPDEMFGKLMSMDDSMILPYFELATDVDLDEINGMKLAMKKGMNPRDVKAKLATTIVTMFHSKKAAEEASKNFDALFKDHAAPENMPKIKVLKHTNIIEFLVDAKMASSKTEARRLIGEGAIKLDGVRVDSTDQDIFGTKEGVVVQRGKRRFIKVVN